MPDVATPRPAAAASEGVARRASILLALAFAAIAVVLVSNPESSATAVPGAREAAPMTAAPPSAAVDSTFEDPTVDAAVRQWVWETPPSAATPPGRAYDVLELWLPSSN
jgi:hypothetical protein